MKTLTKNAFALSALVLALSACSTTSPNLQGVSDKASATIQSGVAKTKQVIANNFPPKADGQVLAEPNVPLNESYKVGIKDKDTASVNAVPSIAATAWQEYYADERLKALIELGLANNKSLEKAILSIQQAKVAYQIQEVKNIPTVGANAGFSRGAGQNGDKNPSNRYSVGLGISSYELDFWGKVSSLKEKALQEYLATAAAKDSAQIALISNIAQAYINLSYAKAQLYLAESTVASRERSLFIAQKRFEAGVDSKAPSLQAQVSLDNARLAVLNAKTGLAKTQNALEYLIGGAVPDGLMPEPAISELVNKRILNAGLPSELLYHRPDIATAEYNLKAAGANINVARAAFFPSISLTTEAGLGSAKLSDLFKGRVFAWSFSPRINLPIFDAGQRKANYESAKLAQEQALLNYEDAIQKAFREVHDVLADRANLGEQLETQYRLQDNIQESYNIAYATFRSGLSDYLSVLDAERSLFGVQQSILELEKTKILSQISLYEKLGGGASLEAGQITKNPAIQEKAMTTAQIANPEQVPATTTRSPITPKQAVEKMLADGARTPINSTTPITPVSDGVAENGDEAIPDELLQTPTQPVVAPPIPPATTPTKSAIKRTVSDDESPIKLLDDNDETN